MNHNHNQADLLIAPAGAHPVADMFPMLDDEELTELAADIRERGLLHPIVLDTEGRILDGRNRLAACYLAEVVPQFVTYEGDDPEGYALAVNIARRHLTKGQIAMVAAKAAAFLKSSLRDIEKAVGVSNGRIAYARTVLQYAPELVELVISGDPTMPLNKAYAIAAANKQGRDAVAEAARAEVEDRERRFTELKAAHPDLAELVTVERLTLVEAEAAAKERERRFRQDCHIVTDRMLTLIRHGEWSADEQNVNHLVSMIDWDYAKSKREAVTVEGLRATAALTAALADALAAQEEAERNG